MFLCSILDYTCTIETPQADMYSEKKGRTLTSRRLDLQGTIFAFISFGNPSGVLPGDRYAFDSVFSLVKYVEYLHPPAPVESLQAAPGVLR